MDATKEKQRKPKVGDKVMLKYGGRVCLISFVQNDTEVNLREYGGVKFVAQSVPVSALIFANEDGSFPPPDGFEEDTSEDAQLAKDVNYHEEPMTPTVDELLNSGAVSLGMPEPTVDAAYAAGDFKTFDTMDELIADLNSDDDLPPLGDPHEGLDEDGEIDEQDAYMNSVLADVDWHIEIEIDPEFQSLIPALQDEEYAQLEASLLEEGCRDALVLWNGILIDGHNRYSICQRHNLPFHVVERDFDSREDVIIWMVNNQLARRNIANFVRSELVLRMKSAIATKAKAQQVRKPGNFVPQNSAEQTPIETREELAKLADVSHDTIYKVEVVINEAPEAIKEAARNGDITINRAFNLTRLLNELPDDQQDAAASLCEDEVEKARTLARLYKSSGSSETNGTYDEIMSTGGFHFGDDMEEWCNFHERTSREIDSALRSVADWHKRQSAEAFRQRRIEEKQQIAQTLPPDIYNVIYADPAWEYNNTGLNGAAEDHYETMPIEDIYKLPSEIGLCVADNAVLFLWVTNPFLTEGMECVRRWGFEYKTHLAWVKTELDKPGVGWYVRGRHELLFVATRGSFTPLDEHISPPIGSVITAPIQEHSRKPDEAYEIIERLYPGCNRIELFARRSREGWASWGDEIDAAE